MIEDLLAQVSADRLGEHIRSLEGVRHRVTAPEALERAAGYIEAALQSLSYVVEPRVFQVRDRDFRNIVATRPGIRDPEERVLIIAHYDTVEDSPGADDNASGIAALLELARVLEPAAFDRTVQFAAVNLEERQWEGPLLEASLFGSQALAADAEAQGWKIGGAIVLEAIAYAGEQLVQQIPPGVPVQGPIPGNFIAVVGNEASQGLVERFVQAVARCRIPLPVFPQVVPGNGEILPDTRRSDHAPFWDRGYPAVMVTDTANFRNPHYHQPTDTLDTLNLPFLAEVCRAVAGTVADTASVQGAAIST